MLIVFGLLGIFAVQNDGTQTFSFLGYAWQVPTWAPAAAGVALTSVLLVLRMAHAGVHHRFSTFGHQRTVDEHRGLIAELRSENARLREQLAAATGRTPDAGPVASLRDNLRTLRSRVAGD